MIFISEKKKWPRAEALDVAQEIFRELAPACETDRLLICGSLRRLKPAVGDVEILFVPKVFAGRATDFFAPPSNESCADVVIDGLLKSGVLAKRGGWGPLNKLAVHVASGIGVDLFAEPNPSDWWRSVVIRTGPKELNVRLIQSAAAHGLHVHAYGTGITDARGTAVPCGSEPDFFKLCRVDYLDPKDRQ